jgi:hypothetical protein
VFLLILLDLGFFGFHNVSHPFASLGAKHLSPMFSPGFESDRISIVFQSKSVPRRGKKGCGGEQHQHQSKNCEETPGLVAQAKGLTQTWLMQKQNALKASST